MTVLATALMTVLARVLVTALATVLVTAGFYLKFPFLAKCGFRDCEVFFFGVKRVGFNRYMVGGNFGKFW